MRKTIKYFLIIFVISLALGLGSIALCQYLINDAAKDMTYTEVGALPYRKVGLLLGTSKFMRDGEHINPYYLYRIDAAELLLKEGKIKYLIISGDNSRKTYSEPEDMRNDLMERGIDSSLIFLDYAGFRTFDSVVRLREIFSQTDVTIISQAFHNERAIYIAKREGIEAIGFNAADVSKAYGFKVMLREKLARVKVFVDMLINTQPKFLGEKVMLPD